MMGVAGGLRQVGGHWERRRNGECVYRVVFMHGEIQIDSRVYRKVGRKLYARGLYARNEAQARKQMAAEWNL